MNGKRDDRLLFVGGAPRSGTTMVQNILDSHPAIAGGPEFDRTPEFIFLRRKLHQSIDAGRISVFVTKEMVDAQLASALAGMLLPYADRKEKQFLSEKTPWNVVFFQELSELFPDARFVLVIRDPRAVASSLMQVGRKHGNWWYRHPKTFLSPYVFDAIDIIRMCADAALSMLDDKRLHVCTYENMINAPELETRKLAKFIGVDWHEQMIRPEEQQHDGEHTLDGVFYDQACYKRNIDANNSDVWKSNLLPWQQVAIERAFSTHPLFKSMGYFPEPTQCNAMDGIHENIFRGMHRWAREIRWELYRVSGIKNELVREVMVRARKPPVVARSQ